MSDLELARRAIAGDEAAIAEIIERAERTGARALAELASRSPGVRAHEQDFLQRFRIMVTEDRCRLLERYEGRASLSTWLRVVATRFFLRCASSLPKEQTAPAEHFVAIADVAPSPEQIHEQRSVDDAVKRAVADLPADDQLLLALLYEQEVPAHEVGKALALTPSGVRMRKQRLLRKLAKRLKELAP